MIPSLLGGCWSIRRIIRTISLRLRGSRGCCPLLNRCVLFQAREEGTERMRTLTFFFLFSFDVVAFCRNYSRRFISRPEGWRDTSTALHHPLSTLCTSYLLPSFSVSHLSLFVLVAVTSIRNALVNAGYQVSRSHASAGSLKTDAPYSFIFDILREWIKTNPVKMENVKDGSPTKRLLSREQTCVFVFAAGDGLASCVLIVSPPFSCAQGGNLVCVQFEIRGSDSVQTQGEEVSDEPGTELGTSQGGTHGG